MAKVTQKDLEGWLEYYQDLLGLKHWHIQIRFGSHEEMEGGTVEGSCEIYQSLLSAYILILHPDYYPKSARVPQDIQTTVLHEVLHIPLEATGAREEHELELEQAMVHIQRAIRRLEDERTRDE